MRATVYPAARGGGSEWALLAARGAEVVLAGCDTAEPAAVRRLLSSAGMAGLRGVWHAAGVLADAVLASQTAATLQRVYAPKAVGGWGLLRACAASPLDVCALFSSVAALLGGGGQANYSAANCCLDALAASRHARARARTRPLARHERVQARVRGRVVGLPCAAQQRRHRREERARAQP